RNQFWIGVLALGALVAGAHSAAAQEYVGAIDMPLPFDMLGGQGMSLNPSTGRLYIPDYYGSNGVAVVDIVTNKFLYELPVPSALATAYDPVRNRVYATSNTQGEPVYVIDAANDTILHTLDAGFWLHDGIACNPITGRIYAVVVSFY